MKRFLLFAILLLNLLPVIKDRELTLWVSAVSAQNMGNEQLYHCEDEDGFKYTSPWPCDEEPCVQACEFPDCDFSGPCDEISDHAMTHYEDTTSTDPDDPFGSDNPDFSGDGDDWNTGGGGNTGGSVTNPGNIGGNTGTTTVSNKRPGATKITSAAKKAVASIPGRNSMCNVGVQRAFQNAFGYLPAGMNGLANEMGKYFASHPDTWQKIPLSDAQDYANNGYFVVGSYINPRGHGHVVVVVPGREWNSKSWGGTVPTVMDTGEDKRYSGGNFANSFGKNKVGKVIFYLYK